MECVCVYVCVCVCTYVCTYIRVCVHICVFMCTSVCVRGHTHNYKHIPAYTHMHTYMHSHTHKPQRWGNESFVAIGKKKTDDVKEEPEEVTRAREELAAKRAKFPGLCLPDDTVKAEVTENSS